jgi:hypothetical protein
MRLFTIQNTRRLIQGLFLLLFLFLFIQTESKGNDELGYPVRLFLDFDPLILVTTAVVTFQVLIDRAGLVAATAAVVILGGAARGRPRSRWP